MEKEEQAILHAWRHMLLGAGKNVFAIYEHLHSSG